MTAHRAVHQVALCRVLSLSPSGYYAWRKRPLSKRARTEVELTAHIGAIHRMLRGTYGAPRIHAELATRGLASPGSCGTPVCQRQSKFPQAR